MKHEEFEADFSDYLEKALSEPRMKEVEAHLASCADCHAEFEKFREAVNALSGLHRMAAPTDMGERVTETIHRRSAGRFFGRKAFGERVPYEMLALVAVVIGVAVVLLIRWSATGSVHEPLEQREKAPPVDPGVKELVKPPSSGSMAPGTPGPTTVLAAGSASPDFEAVAHDGTTVRMSAMAGKPVVLYFYPKDDTPG